jgi:hypothetical protein
MSAGEDILTRKQIDDWSDSCWRRFMAPEVSRERYLQALDTAKCLAEWLENLMQVFVGSGGTFDKGKKIAAEDWLKGGDDDH